MRVPKCHILLILLIFCNLCLMWYFTHVHNDIPTTVHANNYDVTIVIPSFENFENNIRPTINQISSLYPGVPILVLSDKTPYPYLNLPNNAQFVIQGINPVVPKRFTDPFWYIKTKYVLVLPDGSRIKKHSLNDLIWQLKEDQDRSILIASIVSPLSSCFTLDVELKRWTLRYGGSKDLNHCNAFNNDVGILFSRDIVQNFSNVFDSPFYESFFMQAKLNHINLLVSNQTVFSLGKILFTDSHNKWKHTEKQKKQQTELYKRFGIKRTITAGGIEAWYGCTKTTSRCFPTVLDIPYYLYDNRWTPPCCLNALRQTTRHVILTLGMVGVTYWLEGGSLLGAARYGDIIPWDYDVDLGVYLNDVVKSKFLSSVWKGRKKRDEKGYIWEKASEGDFIRVQYSSTNHLHVDIFPFYEREGTMTKNTWFKTHRQDREFPARYLKPLERMQFAGIMALVPNNHKDFLELKFGDGVIENPQYPFPDKLGYKNRFGAAANNK